MRLNANETQRIIIGSDKPKGIIMQQRLLKKTAVFSLLFAVAAMGIMIGLSTTRVITISEIAQDEVMREQKQPAKQQPETDGRTLLFDDTGKEHTDYLCIPLPETGKAEDITIENHYMDREMCVLLNNVESSFYEEHALSGNHTVIQKGEYTPMTDGVMLKFQLDELYEYRTVYEDGGLYISFLNPRELYNRIVVVDPVCGGLSNGNTANGLTEKEIALQIARSLKKKLDDSDIKAYYTRMDDVNPPAEKRIAIANEVKADMYIAIAVDAREDTSVYGVSTLYNDEYFIPGFGSVELADLLEKETAAGVKTKALGLEKDVENTTLGQATVPAAEIRVGCMTNPQEAILLGREDYIEKIATGIYNAINDAYDMYLVNK